MTAAVARLWRHPVKSMRGEELGALTVAHRGVLGDRAHAFVEVETGMPIGEQVVVHVVMPTPRCVMTTRAQGDLARDRQILRTLTRVSRRDVPVLGESPCAGTYADVVRPGVVRAGDAVRIQKVAPRRGAIAHAMEILQRDRG